MVLARGSSHGGSSHDFSHGSSHCGSSHCGSSHGGSSHGSSPLIPQKKTMLSLISLIFFIKLSQIFLGPLITAHKFSRLKTDFEIIVFKQLWKVKSGNFILANNQIMIIFSITYGLKGVV